MPLPFGISRQRAYLLSRDRNFLLRTALAIVGISVGVAMLIWSVTGWETGDASDRLIAEAKGDPEEMLELIRWAPEFFMITDPKLNQRWRFTGPFGRAPLASDDAPTLTPDDVPARLAEIMERSDLSDEQRQIFTDYGEALYGADEPTKEAAFARLREQVVSAPATPFLNEVVADLYQGQDDSSEAESHFRAELGVRPSEHAVEQLIALIDNPADLQQLLDDQDFRNAATAYDLLALQIELKNIGGIFVENLRTSFASYEPIFVGLGLFVAAVWFIIIGQFAGFRRSQLVLYFCAVLLGAFSAILTVFAVILQQNVYETMLESQELIPGLIYNIAGIGLREESIKLLCFLPLVPLVAQTRLRNGSLRGRIDGWTRLRIGGKHRILPPRRRCG